MSPHPEAMRVPPRIALTSGTRALRSLPFSFLVGASAAFLGSPLIRAQQPEPGSPPAVRQRTLPQRAVPPQRQTNAPGASPRGNVPATPAGVAPTAPLQPPSANTPLVGSWKGVYYSYPNVMTVEVEFQKPASGPTTGTLKFYPAVQDRSALGVSKGSYQLAAEFDDASRTFVIKPGAWIERPNMGGAQVPIMGVFDAKTSTLAGTFYLPSAPNPQFFVLAPGATGERLVADIVHSAHPSPEEQNRAKALQQQASAQQRMQMVRQNLPPGVAEKMEAARRKQLDQREAQRQKAQEFLSNLPEATRKAAEDQMRRNQAMEAPPTAAETNWTAPTPASIAQWASRLKTEMPGMDLRLTSFDKLYLTARNLFEDDTFKACFGIRYEDMTPHQRLTVHSLFTRDGGQPPPELPEYVFLGRPFALVGDFGAPDITVSVFWQRSVRAWMHEMEAVFTSLPARESSFAIMTAVEAMATAELAFLWPSERTKMAGDLTQTRTRLALPTLQNKLHDLEAAQPNRQTLLALDSFSQDNAKLLAFVDDAGRATLQQRASARIDGILDTLMPAEMQRVRNLGTGLRAVEAGSEWYERFRIDYARALNRPPAAAVFAAFKQRRKDDFAVAGVGDEMISQLRTPYERIPNEVTAETERARLDFCNQVYVRLNKWFAVPGDFDDSPVARKVRDYAAEIGGHARRFLSPSNRTQVKFQVATSVDSDRPVGTPRERLPVPETTVELALMADTMKSAAGVLPVPISDAGFEIQTDICWNIFHGRFPEIRNAHDARSGLGTKMTEGLRGTNPQFHYAFVEYVGLTSHRYGKRQFGDTGMTYWVTTTYYNGVPISTDETPQYAVYISASLADYYANSYKIAENAANIDGMFGDNLLGYMQTAAQLMKDGIFSKSVVRADGKLAVLRASWEGPILADIGNLLDRWPDRSEGVWQFHENIRRFLSDQPSLQTLFAQTRSENGWNELHVAARQGDVALAKKALGHGIQVDARDNKAGRTALHLAAAADSVDVIDVLVKSGADVNARSRIGETPLHVATFMGSAGAVERLIAAKATVDLRNEAGATPLLVAAERGNASVLKALLAAGANPTQTDETGMNVLHRAAAGDRVEVMNVLLSRPGVNVQLKTKTGWTALHFAAKNNARNAIGVLVAKGLDVNGKTLEGFTPLHVAAMSNATDAIEALILRGAKIGTTDVAGRTPLEVAIGSNAEAAIIALRKHGATSQ